YDTGRGIPADKVEEVFARFVKLDEYSSGTGLGLSLCRLIVERFGGKIWVDPSYLKGAKLVFTIPPADETAFLDS
ncbi:MAG: ATP-binding protein, partial [Bacteroidales bacterium]|nr:ATP-binding protein [Bacteroidales bacterium]